MTDLGVLETLTQPSGKDVVDVGCGDGTVVRRLAALGARVIGVEVSEDQLAIALNSEPSNGARYIVGSAQHLPLGDASVDIAVFMRSLHHVPARDLMLALREARRVIRTNGMVYVAEPLPEGDYFALTSLIEDEVEARTAAQAALGRSSVAGLARVTTREYDLRLCITDLAMLRARIVSVDPERAERFDCRVREVEEAFEKLGEPGEREDERCFLQPMRADLLRPVLS